MNSILVAPAPTAATTAVVRSEDGGLGVCKNTKLLVRASSDLCPSQNLTSILVTSPTKSISTFAELQEGHLMPSNKPVHPATETHQLKVVHAPAPPPPVTSIPACRLENLPFLNTDDASARAGGDWMGCNIFSDTSLNQAPDGSGDGQPQSESQQAALNSGTRDNNTVRVAKPTMLVCVCPNCGRRMGTSRFAPHLEKCMGGRNARTKTSQTLNSNLVVFDNAIVHSSRTPSTSASLSISNTFGDANVADNNDITKWDGNGKRTADAATLDEASQLTNVGHATACYVCMQNASREEMVQCDTCDRVYHLWCTSPRLNHVPKCVPWFCFECGHLVLEVRRVAGSLNGPLTAVEKAKSKSKVKRKGSGKIKKSLSFGKNAMEKARLGFVATNFKVIEYFCDVCNAAVANPPTSAQVGCRWRCLRCPNFDVCDACFCANKTDGVHRPRTHPMVKILVPALQAPL